MKCQIQNGVYVMSMSQNNNFVYVSTGINLFPNTAKKQILEISYKELPNLGNGDFSILVGYNGSNNLKCITLSSDYQSYSLASYANGGWSSILDWTATNNLFTSNSGKWNIIRLELKDGDVAFYSNGNLVYNWQGSGLSTLDAIGLGINVYDNNSISSPSTMHIDYIKASIVE